MSASPLILFICQHNAGRSQLGAHLLGYIASERVNSISGGISPAAHINLVIAESLQELGIDTSGARPRAVTAADLRTADVVITMKSRLTLPGPITGRLIEWEFPDPDSWDIEGVRGPRDRVLSHVRTLALDSPAPE